MHHGESKNRRGWCISNHGPTSNSSTMATFLVVHHAHGQQVQPHNHHAHFRHLQVAVGECLYRFLNVCHLRLDYIDSRWSIINCVSDIVNFFIKIISNPMELASQGTTKSFLVPPRHVRSEILFAKHHNH
jgi:hypothetical protein